MNDPSGQGRLITHTKLVERFIDQWARRCGTTAAMVWLTLWRHADYSTCVAFPALETLAAKLGVKRCTITRSINKLEGLGLLTRSRGGGHTPTRYTIILPVAPVQQLTTADLLHQCNSSRRTGDTAAGAPLQQRQARARNSSRRTSAPRTDSMNRLNEQQQQQAHAAPPSAAAAALIDSGFESGSKLLSETLALPGIELVHPDKIKSIAAACKKKDKGPPIIKREIKTHLEALANRVHKAKEQRQTSKLSTLTGRDRDTRLTQALDRLMTAGKAHRKADVWAEAERHLEAEQHRAAKEAVA